MSAAEHEDPYPGSIRAIVVDVAEEAPEWPWAVVSVPKRWAGREVVVCLAEEAQPLLSGRAPWESIALVVPLPEEAL